MIKAKLYNWPLLIIDISEVLTLNQYDFGKTLGTTQQTVSRWISAHRSPSKYADKIFALAIEAKIDPENYLIGERNKDNVLSLSDFKALPQDVKDFAVSLSNLPENEVLIDDLNRMIDMLVSR